MPRKKTIISTAIVKLRTLFGMTQAEFARKLGIATITLKKYETETERIPPFEALWEFRRLAEEKRDIHLSDVFYSATIQVSDLFRAANCDNMSVHLSQCWIQIEQLREMCQAAEAEPLFEDLFNSLLEAYRGVQLGHPSFTTDRGGLAFLGPLADALQGAEMGESAPPDSPRMRGLLKNKRGAK